MYCCSAQESKMDYKRRFLLGGSKQKVQQHQQYQMPELSRTLSAPLGSTSSSSSSSSSSPSSLASTAAAGGNCGHPVPHTTPIADIQQGISKYLDALNVFCRASAFLTDLFSGVFRNSHYSKAAMQLKDVQEHVTEAAGRLTAAIKPEIAKMLMELSAGAANFKDQNEFSLQDIEVLGRCFLTVMQVHFQFLSQALQKVQPVAQSCFTEVLAQAQERKSTTRNDPSNTELEEAVRSWKGAAEATSRLRERGRDGCLSGIEVQQLFCSQNTTIPEHQLKELNMKIDNALQAYKVALESLGHGEYALKAGFHLNAKSVEVTLQGCCGEAEAQQAGRMQTTSQPIQSELPTIPVQIGSHFLKGVSFNESAAENLKLKTQTVFQLIKEAAGENGISPRDNSSVTEVLNQVCPSSWRGACKTAVQLLFGQAGLVVVDTAQIENKEAYAPQISLEGSRIVVQVPSTWCLKEDPATMSLLQRSLDPEKTLGLVDVLYTAVFDLNRWKERREQALPTIQIQLQRESSDYGSQVDLPSGAKSSSGLPKTISKLTSKFTKKASCSSSSSSTSGCGSFSIPNTPSRSIFTGSSTEDKSKLPNSMDVRLQSIFNIGSFPRTMDSNQARQGTPGQLLNGYPTDRRELAPGEKGMNLPTDQEMQDVIDFLSGFNMGKSQQASPLVKRRNSVAASSSATEQKPPSGVQPAQPVSHAALQPPQPVLPPQQHPTHKQQQQALQYYQHLLQPIGQQQQQQTQSQSLPQPPIPQQQQQRVPAKWLGSSTQHPPPQPPPAAGLSPIGQMGQWGNPGLPDLSSDLYSLGLVSTYMDSVVSEMLGQKPQGPRNNTWPNRDQNEGVFGMLGDILPFDPAVGSDPEFARYVAGVSQAMQHKRQAQHVCRPSNTRSNWAAPDEPHRTWPPPKYYTEGDVMNSSWSGTQGDSASSSDETSSANGDSLFSMFSGPDLVAAVKQRRKHSSDEQEACTLPSPPLHPSADDINQDSKTKTWPPKAPWQHSSPLTNTLPSQSSSLYQMTNPVSQWNESMQMLQSPVWSTASDCAPSTGISSSFAYTQQQQQQQASQHKQQMNKGFKSFPVKHERRPSYLHQY
ncbi:granule associated Rac and RHOG effector protein 1-like isoform X1 [Acipenser ruthenus]|nr:granule associated Rac and RHOG effector protein 1-like isoform X1 [Acipenser ruthenus]XP_033898468.1 granule associated Rac and RHOG effector protein 1-like isoform X1 [Acipenser ruthenus]XP_033898469.1 granule associated Rac and RHOG effector protein 1-like isoform X1 [Acipenser ruthenus]XP_058849597.1 granule associated Rac and RHOG effector protein 1-like isoform X1 [Acipenser ruthenus]